MLCQTSTNATSSGATESTSIGQPTCNAGSIDDDVWFKFIATTDQHLVTVTGANPMYYPRFEAYSGSCGNLTSLGLCPSTGTGNTIEGLLKGLTSGTTYFIRVNSWMTNSGYNGSFSICITSFQNDDCSGAVQLSLGASCNPTYGSTRFATESTNSGQPVCSGFSSQNHNGWNDDDVWYKFTTPASPAASYNVDLNSNSFILGTRLTSPQMTIYSGNCGNLTPISSACTVPLLGCPYVNGSKLDGLSPNTTYYIRVYSWVTAPSYRGQFEICINSGAGGGTQQQSVTPIFDPIPAICSGGSFTLPATSKNNIQGTWTPALNNTTTTTYTFTPGAGQCATTTTLTVTVNSSTATPIFDSIPAICAGGIINLPVTSKNGITGTWSPAVNNATTTIYTFTPASGQCASTAKLKVTVTTAPTAGSLNGVQTICAGGTAVISSTQSGGFWSSSDVGIATIDAATGVINAISAGTATITYTVAGTGGCPNATVSRTLTVLSAPVPVGNSSQNFCQGAKVSNLSASGSNIQWYASVSGGAPLPGSQTLINGLTYYASQSLNGCESSSRLAVTVSIDSASLKVSGVSVICGSNPIKLIASAGFGSYEWRVNGNLVTTNDTFLYSGGDLQLVASTIAGCKDTFLLKSDPVKDPNIDFSINPDPICVGTPVKIFASGSFSSSSYDWLLPGSDKPNIEDTQQVTVNYAAPGDYDITLNLAIQGCLFPKTQKIKINTKTPGLVVAGPPFICGKDSLLLEASGSFQKYQWYVDGDLKKEGDNYSFKGGNLKLIAFDQAGCRDSFLYNAFPLLQPVADFEISPATAVDALTKLTFTNTSMPSDSIKSSQWSFSPPGVVSKNKDVEYVFNSGGTKAIQLIVTGNNGCSDTISKTILIKALPIPNVFTPDQDDFNQYFVIPDLADYPVNKISIYDRWGVLVFEKENYMNDWDGDNLPSSTYFYVLSAEGLETRKGTISILRK